MFRMTRLWAVLAATMLLGQVRAPGMASAPRGLTMLVVPARYSVLQVAFDLLQKREAVLVAYQGDVSTPEPLLHAWNGHEWVYVPLDSYAKASFLQVTPSQIVIVGEEDMVPTALVDASAWCPRVMSIPSVDTATLVNSFGDLFNFRRGEWGWFAGRYNLSISDLNEARRKTSWYDRPGPVEKGTSYRSRPRVNGVEEEAEAEVIMPDAATWESPPAVETEPAPQPAVEGEPPAAPEAEPVAPAEPEEGVLPKLRSGAPDSAAAAPAP